MYWKKNILPLLSVACLLVVLLNGSMQNLNAQQYYKSTEFGLSAGASQYFGDLNPNLGMKHIRPAFGFIYKKNFNPYIAISGNLWYTNIGYKDSYADNEYQKRRNLSFTSPILEVSAMGEFNFFWFETGNDERRFTPYLTLGVSAFYYEPSATYNGKKYNLRELGTEGQNLSEYKDRKYNQIGVGLPVGAGVKWWLAPGVNLSMQIVNRFTFNDYLDDVSKTYVGIQNFERTPGISTPASILQDPSMPIDGVKHGKAGNKRGDESTKDQFLVASVTLTFQLKTYKCPKFDAGKWDGSQVNY